MRIGCGALGATWFALTLSPLQAAAPLVLSADGITVYDSANNISWLANANLPASGRFGLPVCSGSSIDPKTCVNSSGSMTYQAAAVWVAAMNASNYLGHSNWQLPTTPLLDSGCGFIGPQENSFGWNCAADALGSLFYNALGLKAPNTAVPIPNNTAGPLSISNLISIGRKRSWAMAAMGRSLSLPGTREATPTLISCTCCQ